MRDPHELPIHFRLPKRPPQCVGRPQRIAVFVEDYTRNNTMHLRKDFLPTSKITKLWRLRKKELFSFFFSPF
jgi:hypothetical protein